MVLQLQSPETPTSPDKKCRKWHREYKFNWQLYFLWQHRGTYKKRETKKWFRHIRSYTNKDLHVLNWLPEKLVEMQAVARIQQHGPASSAGVDPHWVGVQDQQEPPWQSSSAPSWPCYLNLLHYEDFHQILVKRGQQTERNQALTSRLGSQI